MNREQEITKKLIFAKTSYYNESVPDMTDSEFDALEDELRELNPDSEYFTLVGAPPPERGKKVNHTIPMRSMQKANRWEDIEKWMEKVGNPSRYIMQLKLDGLAGTAKYKNGVLQYLATRGDGLIGSDVTRWADKIQGMKKTITCKDELEIRGEFIIPKGSKLAEKASDSPLRSIVFGIINRKEDLEDEVGEVEFVAYDVVGRPFNTEVQKEEWLFNNYQIESISTVIYSITDGIEKFEKIKNDRDSLPYEIDGRIIRVDDIDLQSKLEDGNEHHPYWAIAWKFENVGQWTTLKEVEWNTSRLGNVIPVAIFEPIQIGGSTITRSTMSNFGFVMLNGIQIGDRLFIEKANEIIPYIVKVERTPDSKPDSVKPVCKCGSKLSKEGVHSKCTNPNCPEVQIQRILFWIEQVGIEGFKEATLRTLYEENIVKSHKDLYRLTADMLQGIPGIGESKINTILSEIERTKTMTEQEFIARLGIPSVGLKAVKKLEIYTLEDFFNFKDDKYSIGEEIIKFKSIKGIKEDILDFAGYLNLTKPQPVESSNKIKVCATGKAPLKREDLISKINSTDKYEWMDSVGKETKILLTDDPEGKSSKLDKARKLGIQIMTYEEFIQKLFII